MLNMLIVENDLKYAKILISTILKNEENIRLIDIAVNETETLKILKENKIDIILLEFSSKEIDGIRILNTLVKNNNLEYTKSIIILVDNEKRINSIQSPLIYSYELKPVNPRKLLNEIDNIKKIKKINNLEEKIIKQLNFLGFNLAHNGTKYLRDCIMIDYNNYLGEAENLNKQIYPIVAKKNKTTVFNIKNNIIKANDYMYKQCEIKKLIEYFHFNEDKKPTPKIVIKTVLSKI